MTTSVAFSHGPILHWDGMNSQLTATIRNNPVAGHLSPILACSLDVMKESGAPEDEFTEFLAEIVQRCDESPAAMVSVTSPGDPAPEPALTDPQYSTSYLASGPTPAWVQKLDQPIPEVTHACPVGSSNIMPCCGRTPFEVPQDRMTVEPELVTCTVNLEARMRKPSPLTVLPPAPEPLIVGPDDVLVISIPPTDRVGWDRLQQEIKAGPLAGRTVVIEGAAQLTVVKRG